MGWFVKRALTLFWTGFYYLLSPTVFDALGRGCRFQGWIDIPQKGGRLQIGDGVTICYGVSITTMPGASVQLRNGAYIGRGVVISAHGEIDIGNNVLLGEYVCIHDNDHVYDDQFTPIGVQGFNVGTCSVGDNSWLGAGVKMTRNASVGTSSVVAAGAVVCGALPDNTVSAGVPARSIRQLR